MKVSVITPVFNAERFLRTAIESLFDQRHHPLEIIVVDDGSTDGSAAIAREFCDAIVYVRQERQGPPVARNHGLRLATGDAIGFLDADDIWRPEKLAVETRILVERPEIDAVWGRTQFMKAAPDCDDFGQFVAHEEPRFIPALAAHLFRRRVFTLLGGFNEVHRHAEDIDFLARAKEAGVRIQRHSETVLEYRRHDRNITNDEELDRKCLVAAIKRALDRKRQQVKS